MSRPAVTESARIARTAVRADQLRDAVTVAAAAGTDPSATRSEIQDLWAVVAGLAGNIQRDTRLLAGLGRGG